MNSIQHDLRYAMRSLLRAPGFTAVAVLTLALGIGATAAIFSIVNAVLLRPLPGVEEPDRLAAVYTSDFSSGIYGASSWPDYADYRESVAAFSELAAFTGFTPEMNLGAGGGAERVGVVLASGNYFETLGAVAAVGRTLLPADDRPTGANAVAVLSHSLWLQRFGGDPDVVGSTIHLNGRAFTVIGVAPAGFHGTQLAAVPDAWIPLSMAELSFGDASILESRGSRWLGMIGRLAPGATIERATTEVRTVAARLAVSYPNTNRGTLQAPDDPRPMTLVPASQAMIDPAEREAVVMVAWLLGAAASLVLLIGCANLANLQLARATARGSEFALRFSLGASRRRVVRQLLTESLLLALPGGLAGLLVALTLADRILTSGLAAELVATEAMPASVLDYELLACALLLSLGAAATFGLVPALQGSRTELASVLKENGSRATKGRGYFGLRNALVVGQVALALLLLIGAGLLVQSLRQVLAVDRGYTLERALIASIDLRSADYGEADGLAFLATLKERIEAQPQVTASAYARVVPVSPSGIRRGAAIDGYLPQPGEDMEINLNVVGRDYFQTMGISLLRGRGFLTTDRATSAPVAVVNEAFGRRYFDGDDPVGGVFRYGGPDGEPIRIVGMVRDGKYRSLREAPLPYIYVPLSQNYIPDVNLVVSTSSEPMDSAPLVRAELKRLDPGLPLFGVRTLGQHLGLLVTTERTVSRLVVAFGVVALMLAMLGIYSLMTFLVEQRTREIGTRVALGAGSGAVLRLILGRGVLLMLVGLGVGLAAALGATRILSSMLYGVSATDPGIFAGITLLLVTVAMVACYIPARRATKVDPMTALREE
jgi:putative ABC transport system permease protein